MSAQYRTPQQVPGKPPGYRMQPQQPPLIPSSLPFPSQPGMMTGNYGFSGRAGYSPPSIYGYPPYGNYGYPTYSPPGNHPKDLFPGMMPPNNPASRPNVQNQAPQGNRPAVQLLGPKATNGPPAKSVSAPTVQNLGAFGSNQRKAPFGSGPNVQSQAPTVFRSAPHCSQWMGPGTDGHIFKRPNVQSQFPPVSYAQQIMAPGNPSFNGPSGQSQAPTVFRPAPQYPPMMGPQMYMGPRFMEPHGLPRDYQMAPYSSYPFATNVGSAQTRTSSNTCPNKYVTVFGPEGTNLKFHYNSKIGKIVLHKCLQCTGKVYEQNLYKLYSKWYEPISNYVLFARNFLTNVIEQYVFSPKTGGLEQVNYPELKYDSSKAEELAESESIIIYENGDEKVVYFMDDDEDDREFYSRKEHFKYGQWRTIPDIPVKTLLMKELEEKQSEEEEEEEEDVDESDVEDENEYSEYLRTLPPFKIRYSWPMRNDIVFILSPNNGSYSKFVFNKTKKEYESHNCKQCKHFITEDNLIPKYSVYSKTVKTYVFHCKNTETSRMEQYIYDQKTQGFEQVYLPELKYESSMDSRSNTLLVLTGNNCGATSIMRDWNTGKFIKEQYCLKTNQFVQLPIVPVRTFSVKIMESENQKKTIQKTEEPKIQEKKTSEKNLEEPEIQNKKDSDEPKIQEASVKDSEEPQLKNKEDSEESPEDVDNLIREMNECMKQFSLLNDKMTSAMKKEEQMKQLTVTIDENQDPLLNSHKQHQALQIPE